MKVLFRFFTVMMAVAVCAGCNSKKPDAPQMPQAMPVPVAHPVMKSVQDWDEYTGRFESVSMVDVRARVSGFLQSVNFIDGQQVKAGDVLFEIDTEPYQLALNLVQAEYQQAVAGADSAKNDYDRALKLKESLVVSAEELDQREQALAAAQANVDAVQAKVDRARLNLKYTQVTAPISGRVSRGFVDAGNLITGSDAGPTAVTTLLTTIVSDQVMYFYFEASEADFLRYRRMADGEGVGSQKLAVWAKLLDEDDFVHEGHMNFVDNQMDRGTGTIQLRAEFENTDGLIFSGMFGRAKLAASPEYQAVLVPDELVRSNQSRKFVYTVGAENKVAVTVVQPGGLFDGGLRAILGGLSTDDVVITGNMQMLRPGVVVEPQWSSTDAMVTGGEKGRAQ